MMRELDDLYEYVDAWERRSIESGDLEVYQVSSIK